MTRMEYQKDYPSWLQDQKPASKRREHMPDAWSSRQSLFHSGPDWVAVLGWAASLAFICACGVGGYAFALWLLSW